MQTAHQQILRPVKENGSPLPVFESDEDRTFFLIRLPVHERSSDQVTDQVTDQVAGQVGQLLSTLVGEMSRGQLQAALGLAHRGHFTMAYLQPALEAGLIEMTLPDKPRSSKQRYRLTTAGRALVEHNKRKKTTT